MGKPLRILVWQWGRRGGGPRVAVEIAESLATVAGTTSLLSLSAQSELLHGRNPPDCALPFPTYFSLVGFLLRLLTIPFSRPGLIRRLRALAPDVAFCAMPAALDLLMASALRQLGVPFFVLIHDADAHPGDATPMQMALQRHLAARATGLATLSRHVADTLTARGEIGDRPVLTLSHPPRSFGPVPAQPRSHSGPLRLLFFGRLLPYKGLNLFADALRLIGDNPDLEVRIAGHGPDSPALAALSAMPGVTVDNRWVPEDEIAGLLAWSDALVLSHIEASQSGVAAAAIAARRWVVSTRVGGLVEQLQHEPLARMCDPDAASLSEAILSLLSDPPPLAAAAQDPADAWHDMASSLVAQLRPLLHQPLLQA
jgi:glycosyltransferase involved in cell wall biosynthesis